MVHTTRALRRRILSALLSASILLSLLPAQAMAASGPGERSDASTSSALTHAVPASEGVANVIRRAYSLTDVTWTPLQNMPGVISQNGEYRYQEFLADVEYTGIPYSGVIDTDTYVGLNVSLQSFLTALQSENSVLYTKNLFAESYPKKATYFGTVCSKFAQYALNVPGAFNTSNVPNIPGMDTVAMPGEFDLNDMKLGDVIVDTVNHTALCTDILYNAEGEAVQAEISEAVPPTARRLTWTAAEFAEEFADYRLCRYRYIDDVPAAAETDTNAEPSLMPRYGDGYNYRVSTSRGVVDILKAGYAKAVILREGVKVEEIALDESTETFSFNRSVPGELEMYLETADGEKSESVYACVVDSSVTVTDHSNFFGGTLSVSYTGTSGTPLYVQLGSGQSVFCALDGESESVVHFNPSAVSGGQARVAYENEFGIYLSPWTPFTIDESSGTGPNPSSDALLSQGVYWDGWTLTPTGSKPVIQEGKEDYWTYAMVPVEGSTTYYSEGANRSWYFDSSKQPISTINVYKDCTPAYQFTTPSNAAYMSLSYSPQLVEQGTESMRKASAEDPLEGKTLSVLGASISTYAGTSNGTAANTTNSTIRNNAKYYPHSVVSDVTLEDTWWMQTCEDLGLRLLVNNAWSGSAILLERSGTKGAYVDRCVQLHDDTGDNAGEEPDIICIQMGFNDFSYGKATLGTSDIDYDALITADGYGTPATTMEATAIMLDKMAKRYPDAEIYMFSHFPRVGQSASDTALMEELNDSIATVCGRFGVTVVDLYNALTDPAHIGDGRLHPNRLGMDVITEAVKTAILSNHPDTVAHTVSLDLDGVTADYGADKRVLDGGSFSATLTAAAGNTLEVTVTMGGEDITASCYADGVISIPAVTGDVTVSAAGVHTPKNYRWEFDGTDLTGENELTKIFGTTADGVFSNTCYALEQAVVLRHDLPWAVEWKCEGSWKNSGSATGGRLFSGDDVNAHYNVRYIFKSSKNGLLAIGEKTSTGSHNYGIALADHGIDASAAHTYRLENRIAADGSNMIYLLVDGAEIGAMEHYYVGTTAQNTTSYWLSGKDFVFPYMGTDTHGFTNCSIEYIAVNEAAHTHTYENGVCTVCGDRKNVSEISDYRGKVISVLSASTSTFAGYIPVADGFNLAHRARYPQDNLLTDVNETWWMQLVNELDAKLGINDSWAGSQVLNTQDTNSGDLGPDAAMASLTRIQNLGSNGTPDVILFFGGGNDIGRGVPMGSFDPAAAPAEVDLTTTKWDTFADAYVAAIMRLKHFYPDSKIVAMTSYAMPSYATEAKLNKYGAVIKAICEHYGVPYLDLRSAGVTFDMLPDNVHPNAEGMDRITDAVMNKLLRDVEMAAGENVVYSVTHDLSNAKASLGYYKGVSEGEAFAETLTSEDLTVTVTMGGTDITASCYAGGEICIPAVTGDVKITAKAAFDADGHLQQLPENVCAGTNLWTALTPEKIYYTANGWGNSANGNSWSITFPVREGDRIWATSLGAYPENGSSANGIRITWFDENGVLATLSRDVVYAEFAQYGYVTAPEGAVALNLPMTGNRAGYAVKILTREHIYGVWAEATAPTCDTEGRDIRVCESCGGEQYRDTRISGDPDKILVSDPVAEGYFSGKNLLLIGDSITAGVGTTKTYGEFLAESLGVNVTNKGVSGSGYCSGGAMSVNRTLTADNVRDADVITVLLGVNDWCWSVKDGSWNGDPDYYDPSQTYYQLGTFDSADTSTFYGALHSWCQNIVSLQQTAGFEDKQFVVITPLITSWNSSVGERNWDQDKQNIHGHVFREYCAAIMEVCAYYGIPVFDANMYSGIYYRSAEDNNVDVAGGDGAHINAAGHELLAAALKEFLLEGYSYESRSVAAGGHVFVDGVCENCRLPEVRTNTPPTEYAVKNLTGGAGQATYSIDADEKRLQLQHHMACAVLIEHPDGSYTRLDAAQSGEGYTFDISGVGEEDSIVIIAKGDANRDGQIMPNEVAQIKAIQLGKLEPTSELQYLSADLNGDGQIMPNEIAQIKTAQLGKLDLSW